MENDFGLAAFDATFDAIDFKRRLDQVQVSCAVMPLPQSIESSCGLAVRFGLDQMERAMAVREEAMGSGASITLFQARILEGRPVFTRIL